MKINKLMNTLLVFLILIICVGAVSANEDASTDSIPTEDAQSLAIVQDSPLNSDVQPLDSSPDLTLNEIDNTQISDSDKNQNDESKGALGTDSTADGQYVGGSDDGESDDSEPPIIVYNQGNIRYVLSGHSIVSDETYRVLGTWGPSHYHNHYIDYTFECASLPWLMNDTTWVYCIHCGSRDPDGADFLPGIYKRITLTDEKLINKYTQEDILPFLRTLIYLNYNNSEDFGTISSGKVSFAGIIDSFVMGNYRDPESRWNRQYYCGKTVGYFVEKVLNIVDSGNGINNSGAFYGSDFLTYQFYLYVQDPDLNYAGDYQQLLGFNIFTKINVTKEWDDNNNSANKRPDSVEVQLYANGEKTGNKVNLNNANNWTYTFTDLPVYYSFNMTHVLEKKDYEVMDSSSHVDRKSVV